MTSYTLLVFEGETEKNVVNSLKSYFITKDESILLYATFGHNIYQLSNELENDPGLDLHGLLCESLLRRKAKDDELLSIPRDSISDIYLFFDYDPHTSNASDMILSKMLNTFVDSQDLGQLFINYPMLESVRHIPKIDYQQITFPIANLTNYKSFLKQRNSSGELVEVLPQFFNWGLYTKEIWQQIIEINLARANGLVFEKAQLPEKIIDQLEIFEAQKKRHIRYSNTISVISGFPLMLHHYYGENIWTLLTRVTEQQTN